MNQVKWLIKGRGNPHKAASVHSTKQIPIVIGFSYPPKKLTIKPPITTPRTGPVIVITANHVSTFAAGTLRTTFI